MNNGSSTLNSQTNTTNTNSTPPASANNSSNIAVSESIQSATPTSNQAAVSKEKENTANVVINKNVEEKKNNADITAQNTVVDQSSKIEKADENKQETSKPTDIVNNLVVNPLKEALFQTPEKNGILTGAVLTLKPEGIYNASNIKNVRDEKLNELHVDGSTIYLFNTKDLLNGINGKFKALSNRDLSENSKVSGTITGFVGGFGTEVSYDPRTFRNMRFGVYNVDNINNLFVQGIATPVQDIQTIRDSQIYPMPTSAKAIYQEGHALYGKEGKYIPLEAEVFADFDKKIITVDLKETGSNTKKLSFEGKIDGNTFSGSTNGIESKGAFYGSRAAEVGGIFYQTQGTEKDHNGVFGATDKRGFR